MISKALLGFSVPDNQPSMTAHYKRRVDYFLTSHSISYTITVIIYDYCSKGWLGSGEET